MKLRTEKLRLVKILSSWSERRYAALKELQEGGGVYLGWSNHVLGAGPFTWSEHMKVSPY
jgi:hypothetical protein